MQAIITRNREHSDEQTRDMTSRITSTHNELVAHRAEFTGLATGLRIGMGGIAFLLTAGIGVLGVLIA